MARLSRVLRAVLRIPVTLVAGLALIACEVWELVSESTGRSAGFGLATGYPAVIVEGRWWTIFTAVVRQPGALQFAIVLVLGVGLLAVSERLLGSLRTLLVVVVTTAIGSALGILLQSVGVAVHELWSSSTSGMPVFDPMTPVVGALLAASAFTSSLWRRRIRVVTISATLVFLLYSGQPADLYAALAGATGLLLGHACRPSSATGGWSRSSHHEIRVLVSAVVAVSALGPVATVFSRTRLGPLAPLGLLLINNNAGPGQSTACRTIVLAHDCLRAIELHRISGIGPVLLTLLPLVTLLVAAFGMVLGRRFAAWLAIVVNVALSGLAGLFYGVVPLLPHKAFEHPSVLGVWEPAADLIVCTCVPLVIAGVVFVNLRHFTVHASRRLVRAYLAGVAVVLIAEAVLYVGLGVAFSGQFRPHVGFLDLLLDLPARFAPVGFLNLQRLNFIPLGPVARILSSWIGPLFWMAVSVGGLVVVVRPSQRVVAGRARARALLKSAGGGSLSYWATWRGNKYWFAADGRAAVAYRVANGVAVTCSEPFGEESAAIAAVAEFARFCDDNGWSPFFYGIHAQFAETCKSMGWSADIIGDETIVNPLNWSTVGKQWQDIRSSINRAERDGLRAEWSRYSELSARHANQIEEISEAWVAEKGLPEMGFTLGGVEELRDRFVQLMVGIDGNDDVVGVTSWLPTWRRGRVVGWTLDFMRRSPDGPNGVMEFLIARSAERFKADAIEFMSLSTAPLTRNPGSTPERSAIAPILRYIGTRLEPVYGFQSLFNFKKKFQPEFRSIYMSYPDVLSLPSIAFALARSYVPSMTARQALRFIRDLGR